MTHSELEHNFILQQGFPEPAPDVCHAQYGSLAFQPRVVALVLFAGIVLQQPWIFAALGAVLWWCAAVPRWNVFEAVYQALRSRGPGRIRLAPAPAPRRFAQAIAGTMSVAIAVALRVGWRTAAIGLEVFLGAAVLALAFGGFCLGSFLFHVIRGRAAFALRTMPWSRGAGSEDGGAARPA